MEQVQKIDEKDCLQVLEKCLNCKNFQLNSFEVLFFDKPFQGMVGEHYTLRVKYVYENELCTQDFFVKTISSNPLLLEFSKSVLVYEKESFFYHLLEEFDKCNIDISFAPRGYFFKPYIVVLEDLAKLDYKGMPRKTLLDLEHCQVCLDTMAKFHAATIIYEKRKSQVLEKYSLQVQHRDLLEDKFNGKEDTMATKWVVNSIEGLFQLVDMIPENQVGHDEFKAALSEILTDKTPIDGVLSTILHGDLWTSNFLYLYKEDKPVGSKLLDYQMINYGPVEQDLVRFLMTNTSKDFRNVYFENMVEYYFEKLQLQLSKADFGDILPDKSTFQNSCENFKLPAKVAAIIDHSFTFVDDDLFSEALQTEDSFRNYLFEERGKYVDESYMKNEIYRERLTEDVLELRDLMFPQI